MKPQEEKTHVTTVKHCARCGGTHIHLRFYKLDNPIDNATHWSPCPENGQPILLGFIQEGP